MKQSSTIFLRGVIWLMGLGVLGLCLFVLPREIASDTAGLYRPIFIGMYVPAIPFFIALWQGLKLLRYIDTNKAFSNLSVTALKKITYCAISISLLYAAGMPYLHYVSKRSDAPVAAIFGSTVIAASLVIAVFAALLQKLLQNAIAIKSENDLTV